MSKPMDAMSYSINEANNLWDDIKKRIVDDPSFIKMSDNEKINIYQESKFKDFYVNFPIVCRYMICMGQFSNKAFKKFLIKCKINHDQKKTTSNEDTWVRSQADYVRYLWESYQNPNFSSTDSDNIWEHAYNTLTQEFADFKELHKNIEDQLKTTEITNKATMASELLNRLKNNIANLDDETARSIINKLKN